jgi:dipeptidase E
MMKLLLTDSGVQNPNITAALVDLLGKPIAESTALFIPTALQAQKNGAVQACRLISGR